MIRIFWLFFASIFYMEVVYHIGCFGFTLMNPVIDVFVCAFLAGLAALFTGFLRRKKNRVVLWGLMAVNYLLFASQLVYMKIFKQPLLLAAAANGGKDALTNYWREALFAVLQASGWLLLMAVPFFVAGFLQRNRSWGKGRILDLRSNSRSERLVGLAIVAGSFVGYLLVLFVGSLAKTDYYENYSAFYDPEGVISSYGVTPSLIRDIMGDAFPVREESLSAWEDVTTPTQPDVTEPVSAGDAEEVLGETTEPEPEEPVLDTSPNVLPIDFDSLIANADSDKIKELAEYMQSMPATNRNEYTGMFEGYNLIFLTAEGFSPYAVDENLTPTLYRLIHSGFVFENYYVPLWQTSTSDGEYANLTALIPDQQFSMRRSADNVMPFALPSYFAAEGVNSYAFHNNTLSYYDRYRSHPNLGYNWNASKLGDLDASVWGSQVFKMDNAGYWPASDLDMMKATVSKYINEDRFHVYYMTVSGHMNYNFSGNRMSSKHKDDVAELPYSEEGRAYIACNMELDLALQYLLEQLEAAGKLENTVICLSADHYPYAMDVGNLEELAGKPLAGSLDIYRNNLILWNSEMETVTIDKPACSMDVLPTLLNLFGFSYDSRLYAGKDILSDSAPLVIFSDRSFITDRVSYYKKGKTTTWLDGTEGDDAYFEAVKKQVKGLYSYSAGILNNNFYKYVEEALPEEYRSKVDPEWVAPHGPAPAEPDPTPTPTPAATATPVAN